MTDRPAIPAALERELMLEVGYRCPLCNQTEPLEIEHIEEWSKVQCHEFTNMIVLCASCHGRKKSTNNPRHINRASLGRLKHNLMMLNGRYSDLERRVLDVFQAFIKKNPTIMLPPVYTLPDTLELLVRNLAEDKLVTVHRRDLGQETRFSDGFVFKHGLILLALTNTGRAFLDNLTAFTDQ